MYGRKRIESEGLIKIPIRLKEKLKSGSLSALYLSLRQIKRKFRGEPLTGVVPVKLEPLGLDELKPYLANDLNSGRIHFSAGMQRLKSEESEQAKEAWKAFILANQSGFESYERVALYCALLLAKAGMQHQAVTILSRFGQNEFTKTEFQLVTQIFAGEVKTISGLNFSDPESPLSDMLASLSAPYSPKSSIHVSLIPKVSVIVPNYNYAPYLKERIRSVLNQTFTDFELLYIDDASSDDSNAMVEREFTNDPRLKIICHSQNSGGVYNRRQEMIDMAKGEWLWFAEADDSADPRFLEMLLNIANANPNVGIVHSRIAHMNELGQVIGYGLHSGMEADSHFEANYIASGDREAALLSAGCLYATSSALILKKEIVERAGGYDSRMELAADWNLYLTMLKFSDAAYSNQPLAWYRSHQNSVTKTVPASSRALEDAFCVANAYLWMQADSRFTQIDLRKVHNRVKLFLFEVLSDPNFNVPENLLFATETIRKVVPDILIKTNIKQLWQSS